MPLTGNGSVEMSCGIAPTSSSMLMVSSTARVIVPLPPPQPAPSMTLTPQSGQPNAFELDTMCSPPFRNVFRLYNLRSVIEALSVPVKLLAPPCVSRARRWSMDDFGEFYAARKDRVLRAVLLSVGDRVAAEDAVAEAFARACARWSRVRTHPNPTAWV